MNPDVIQSNSKDPLMWLLTIAAIAATIVLILAGVSTIPPPIYAVAAAMLLALAYLWIVPTKGRMKFDEP